MKKPIYLLILMVTATFMFLNCKKKTAEQNYKSPVIPNPEPSTKEGFILKADGPGNTYELLNAKLGGTAEEVPDCGHPEFGRHISEIYDGDLKEYVFEFTIHVTPDNDRCNGATDRQRNEIKTYGPSPDSLKASIGETVTYHWKFKLPNGFQPSPSFTHIHQIKAGDGDDGAPIITITPRYGNPNHLEIIHTSGNANTSLGKVASVDLSSFLGNWVEVTEKIKFDTHGTYQITINRISDGKNLLSYTNNDIDLWRDHTTFCRPKWGIYRSLNNKSYLRDEQVRFADFCIAEGDAICP